MSTQLARLPEAYDLPPDARVRSYHVAPGWGPEVRHIVSLKCGKSLPRFRAWHRERDDRVGGEVLLVNFGEVSEIMTGPQAIQWGINNGLNSATWNDVLRVVDQEDDFSAQTGKQSRIVGILPTR